MQNVKQEDECPSEETEGEFEKLHQATRKSDNTSTKKLQHQYALRLTKDRSRFYVNRS
jgi:hypothetical protein